jgi:hypothetical protein
MIIRISGICSYLCVISQLLTKMIHADIKKYFVTIRPSVAKARAQLDIAQATANIEDRKIALRKKAVDAVAEAMAAADRNERLRNGTDGVTLVVSTEQEDVQKAIDAFVNDTILAESATNKIKRKWTSRPANWKEIGALAHQYSYKTAMKDFPLDFEGCTDEAARMRCIRWYQDSINGVDSRGDTRRKNTLGPLECVVVDKLRARMDLGLPVDVELTRLIVTRVIAEHNREDMYQKCTFGPTWCRRFFKRHNLRSRKATTKMRETVPLHFETKKESYLRVGGQILALHDIPLALIINVDETGAQLINVAKRTLAKKGSKRVRLVGIGKDKAQVTVTLAVTAAGGVLPYQIIYKGKTDACHPKRSVPPGCIVTHTMSHWQSVQTYFEYIRDLIIPFKNAKIAELGLDPTNTWTINYFK